MSTINLKFTAAVMLLSLFLSPAYSATGSDAVINADQLGSAVIQWGYDIKWEWKANYINTGHAREVFVDNQFSVLRIPIWGNGDTDRGHPSEGVILEDEYSMQLEAIGNALSENSDVILFASKKLKGDDSFPEWTKSSAGGPIIPEKYAIMLADYLEMMEDNGFYIDVLGIDNERTFNEGNITTSRYKQTIDELEALSVSRGFDMPLLIAPETYKVSSADNWLSWLETQGWGDYYDIAGTHHYPNQWYNSSALGDFADTAGDKPKWHSEVHWGINDGLLNDSEKAMRIVFDCFDKGFSAMTYWGYPFGDDHIKLGTALTRSTAGAKTAFMDDIDGTSLNLGELITRAFREDNSMTVWLINNSSNAYQNYGFEVQAGTKLIEGDVDYTLWESSGGNLLETLGTAPKTSGTRFEITVPQYSIMVFEFDINDDQQPPTPNPAQWAVPPETIDGNSVYMKAAEAEDPSGVEYYFECTKGSGNDSGWQDSPEYTETGLDADKLYAYKVRARDKGPYQNQTAASAEKAVVTRGILPGMIEAENYDAGGQNVGYYDNTAGNAYGDYREDDVEILSNSEGYAVYAEAGEWLRYSKTLTEGTYKAVISSTSSYGMEALLEIEGQEPAGVSLPDTGGWSNWSETIIEPFDIHSSGEGSVRLSITQGEGLIDYVKIIRVIPGTIQAENYAVGGQNEAYYDNSPGNAYGKYRSEDVDILSAGDTGGGFAVYAEAGEWLEYDAEVISGTYDIVIRSSSSYELSGSLQVGSGEEFPLILPDTGSWSTWEDTIIPEAVISEQGECRIRLSFDEGSFKSVSVNYIEFVPAAEPADINEDGQIDLLDYAILAGQWQLPVGTYSADISPQGGDGVVNIADLLEFAQSWLE
ncbi:carbohydrate-binding domain-containing protein [Sedimentisphaera salicampi]|uniref:O-Glycosyl hydrolase n=1 Tax=Sedimentisphaera salicampi TaxID=1941349 RepID=A0A1W6LN44_9BACT|nr:carbohydrate-binding domain-containing protein [Sedimentisphaera salicampi]ARN57199.1 O-Glycosyl hydrolase [Sedimentisphaera salicampi]